MSRGLWNQLSRVFNFSQIRSWHDSSLNHQYHRQEISNTILPRAWNYHKIFGWHLRPHDKLMQLHSQRPTMKREPLQLCTSTCLILASVPLSTLNCPPNHQLSFRISSYQVRTSRLAGALKKPNFCNPSTNFSDLTGMMGWSGWWTWVSWR